jgi:glycosyltransferase involved in cell wall biosynthesis
MTSRIRVAICLATYNGESYLREQLESLKNQEKVEIHIIVGDDGSTDKTLDILKPYFHSGKISEIHHFDRIGINSNFLRLLTFCNDYDFIAFSDQDDIWESTKLYQLSQLLGSEKPELAFCQRSIFGSTKKRFSTKFTKESKVGFHNALVENIAPGNTMMLNRKAVEMIIASNASTASFFDSYIYLLISGLGEVKYLPIPLVNYRIHRNNAVGIRKFGFTIYLESIRNSILNAQLLKSEYSKSLDADKSRLLEEFLGGFQEKNILKSIQSILTISTKRQSILDDLAWRAFAILVRLSSKPN